MENINPQEVGSYNDFTKVDSFILLSSGFNFDFNQPEKSFIFIEDIAHGLSNLCRFNGHCDKFYSVAEHSVLCSYLVEPGFEYAALMHDASEAYLGDISTPLKKLLPDYRVIEDKVEKAIFEAMYVPYPLPKEVKRADLTALAIEKRDLMPYSNIPWTILEGIVIPPGFEARGASPSLAKAMFMNRYLELTSKN